jgi:beta-galactosidase
VIVRSREGGRGALKLHASAPGLKPAQAAIDLRATKAPPSVPRTRPYQLLRDWRMSSASESAPDPAVKLAGNDMNSWASVQPGHANDYGGAPWRLYRIRFTPHADVRRNGGRLVFKRVLGRAEVWVDGVQLGSKRDFDADEFSVAFAAGDGERELTVRVQSRPGEASGFADVVVVESKAGAR